MKTRLAILVAALALPAFAGAKPDEAAIAVFKSVQGAWSGSDAKGVGESLDKDTKVKLSLPSGSDSYSKDQAIAKLDKFFKSNATTRLKLDEDGYQDGPSATYEYEYNDANGKKQKAHLFVSLRKVSGTWVVSEIAVLP